DRVVVMKDGQVVESGSVAEVIGRPQADYTRRLIASQPALMPPRAAPVKPVEDPILTLDDLRVSFVQSHGFVDWLRRRPPHLVRAVDGISLGVNRGEALGIVGESGS